MPSVIESYFSILMLFGASQAVTGIYLLLKDKHKPFANYMLALLLLVWGFSCYWFFAFIHQGPFFSVTVTTFIGPMLALLLFPPIYLYVKFLFYEHKGFPKSDHLHFLPVYLFIVFTLYLYVDSGFSIPDMRHHEWYHARTLACSYIAMVQGPFYFIMTNRILKLRHQRLKEQYSEIESRKLEWLHVINYSFALVFIIGGISAIIRITYLDPYMLYMAYHAVIAVSIFYITLMIFKSPIIFKNPEPVSKSNITESVVTEIPTMQPVTPTISSSEGQLHAKETDIIAKIETFMREDKPYKNPNFSLNDLAAAISESRNAISTVLNKSLEKTFYNYINELRIEESKRLLADESLLHFTIEGIAAESGFKAMSVFYRFFKDIEKETPAVYRKKHLNL